MRHYLVLTLFLLGWSTGCAKYSTHMGRVGSATAPSPLADEDRPQMQAVTYGSAPANRVPELVQPVTRTVWIKGYRRRPGEYVGDYPLTLVYTRAEFVTEAERPPAAIPHAIQIGDGAPTQSSVSEVTKDATPPQVSAAPVTGTPLTSPLQVPPLDDGMEALRPQTGPQTRSSGPDVTQDASPLRPLTGPTEGQPMHPHLQPQVPPPLMNVLKTLQDAQPKETP
jgi:hypothetical protein